MNGNGKITVAIFVFFLALGQAVSAAWACSTVFITSDQGEEPAVVARSMDYECNEGRIMLVGLKGDPTNTSDVNMQDNIVERVTWTNTYDFIGKAFNNSLMLAGGLNSGGLGINGLYLPGVAQYMDYDPTGPPALSHMNLIAYVLGTSGSVSEALTNISKVQVVIGALVVTDGTYSSFPAHWTIRDKTGRSAVVELTKTGYFIYLDAALAAEMDISKLEQDSGAKVVTDYPNAGHVLANSPGYTWENACYEKQDNYFNWTANRTNKTWGGTHQNGSGTYGLRGDWTSPSRFQRGMALLKQGIMPVPNTTRQAILLAQDRIHSLAQPAGVSVALTTWIAISNLKDGEYWYRLLLLFGKSDKEDVVTLVVPVDIGNLGYEKFEVKDVKKYVDEGKENIKHFTSTFTGTLTEDQKNQALAVMVGTAGATPLTTVFAD
jgi:penicillin V acylase-like amidase (Ntn superfamily)